MSCYIWLNNTIVSIQEHMNRVVRKLAFCISENKDADKLRGNRELISDFVFGTLIVQSLYFLNPNFQASSYLLWLYSPECRIWPESPKTGFLTMLRFLLLLDRAHSTLTTEYSITSHLAASYEPRCEKTCLRGVRPGLTQTGLCSHIIWLEA